MKKINLLFVSIAFPPKSDSECLQVAKYYKYLQRIEDLSIDVVTSSNKTLFMPIDKNMENVAQGYNQIIKVNFFENKYINFLRRKISPYSLYYPDSKCRFFKKWRKVVQKLKRRPDIIYSRSYPISSTIMAYKLQEKYNVPWILHLSDPWVNCPGHDLGNASEWNAKMEKRCFEKASIITFSSTKTVEFYQKIYPNFSQKMKFYPNVFDVEDKVQSEYHLKSKIRVVYTGGLVESRSPEGFFNAIIKLAEEAPDSVKDFEFLFAGSLDGKNKLLFDTAPKCCQHLGLLSYKDALVLQESADVLLLIDTPFKTVEEAIFFPSKLLDYMLMKRRIFALTEKESITWDLVDNKLGDCFLHKDVGGIKKGLLLIWKQWKENNTKYFLNNKLDMKFSAQVNAEKLLIQIKEVINEN